jgi:hypothetical protein
MNLDFFSFTNMDGQSLIEFILRFIFDFIIIYILAVKIYYKVRKRTNILFALFMLNILVFFVCYLLQSVQLSIGFAFGIFAIFSILRYRTTTIPIQEMTYIFMSITLAIINALTNINTGYGTMLLTNVVIILFAYIFEKKFIKNESSQTIQYDSIDLIRPERHNELIEELKIKTGLNIHRIELGKLDFTKKTVQIKIYYYNDVTSLDEDFNND